MAAFSELGKQRLAAAAAAVTAVSGTGSQLIGQPMVASPHHHPQHPHQQAAAALIMAQSELLDPRTAAAAAQSRFVAAAAIDPEVKSRIMKALMQQAAVSGDTAVPGGLAARVERLERDNLEHEEKPLMLTVDHREPPLIPSNAPVSSFAPRHHHRGLVTNGSPEHLPNPSLSSSAPSASVSSSLVQLVQQNRPITSSAPPIDSVSFPGHQEQQYSLHRGHPYDNSVASERPIMPAHSHAYSTGSNSNSSSASTNDHHHKQQLTAPSPPYPYPPNRTSSNNNGRHPQALAFSGPGTSQLLVKKEECGDREQGGPTRRTLENLVSQLMTAPPDHHKVTSSAFPLSSVPAPSLSSQSSSHLLPPYTIAMPDTSEEASAAVGANSF